MKKIKILLSVFAFVVAIGATFATQYKSSSMLDGYVFADGTCEQVENNCVAPNNEACEITEGIVRQNEDAASACGQALGKP